MLKIIILLMTSQDIRIKDLERQLKEKYVVVSGLQSSLEYCEMLLKDIDEQERTINVFDGRKYKMTYRKTMYLQIVRAEC